MLLSQHCLIIVIVSNEIIYASVHLVTFIIKPVDIAEILGFLFSLAVDTTADRFMFKQYIKQSGTLLL